MTWLGTPGDVGPLDVACEAVAAAAARHGRVRLLAEPGQTSNAHDLGARVEVSGASLGGCMVQAGPSFVIGERGVQTVDWTRPDQGSARRPRKSRRTETAFDVPGDRSALNLGLLDTDGWGTALLTPDTLERNPGWTRADVEQELADTLGLTRTLWLTRTLSSHGSGHGYAPAVFAAPGVVLVHDQQNIGHPDNETVIETVALLTRSRDAVGRPLRVVRVPAPLRLRESDRWLHWTYLGHGLVDGAVIVPLLDDPNDELAITALREVYPDREVIGVDARPLFREGHSVSCLLRAQPQPR